MGDDNAGHSVTVDTMSPSSTLGSFFSSVSRAFAFVRVTLANLLVLMVLLMLGGIVALVMDSDRAEVPDGAALSLTLEGTIVEQTSLPSPLGLLGDGALDEIRLGDVLGAIDQAAADARIGALVFDPSSLAYVAPAQLGVIGEAFEKFRASGKKIIAKAYDYNRDQYYLASFADEVYLHPMGGVMLDGYGAYRGYYKGLFDMLKVNVHVYRVGTYKTFVEPYTRDDMSPAAKQANRVMIDSLWARFVDRVAANRGLEPDTVRGYADRFDALLAAADGDSARVALEQGLVDALLVNKEISERLRELTGGKDNYRHVAMEDYLAPPPRPSGDTVAVLTATGLILMGDQPPGVIGAETMARLLRDARRDDSIKALVLRVDSSGGSALASELIRQELERLQDAGKPVVVSMAGVAASGGYWIAATADEIWAAPTTITGSIGIFAILPTFEDSLRAIGITRDGVGTGPFAGALNVAGGISAPMERVLQASIDHGYQRFIELVAEGRGKTPEQIDAIAQGRVWTGAQALELGLVDKLGHLEDAIANAATLAGIDSFEVRHLKDPLSPRETLLRRVVDNLGLSSRTPGNGLATNILRDLRLLDALNDPKHVYALCETCEGLL